MLVLDFYLFLFFTIMDLSNEKSQIQAIMELTEALTAFYDSLKRHNEYSYLCEHPWLT